MKAKIKSTGDIMPIAPYAKVTLDVCDDRGTPYEVDFEDVELLHEDAPALCVDWDAFRREAAKDAMSGMMANADFWQHIWSENRVDERCDYPSEIAHFSIACADELIKQLRDGKE